MTRPNYPDGYPFAPEEAYLLSGDTLNTIISVVYGLEVTDGSVDYTEGAVIINRNKSHKPALVEVTSKIETGEYSTSNFYLGNVLTSPENITYPTDFEGALIRHPGGEEIDIGTRVTAIPLITTFTRSDLNSMGLQSGTSITVDTETATSADIIPYPVYYITSAGNINKPIPAQITGGGASSFYTVDLYGGGIGAPSTGTGKVHILNLAVEEEVPTGTWVVVHPNMLTVTGGT